MQMPRDRWLIEPLNHFVQETGDDEALRDFRRNAATAQIKKFVFIDLAAGRAVRATDIVRQDFEAGHRVRFGIVAQK